MNLNETIGWLLACDEPWTRYCTLVDLLDRPTDDSEVQAARAALVAHPQVRSMVTEVATWGDRPFLRHNDAGYPIYKLATLADFGLSAGDPGLEPGMARILAHQAPAGAFQSLVNIPRTFGGSGEDTWTWLLCDAPTLLYALLVLGLGDDPRVQRAVQHLAGTVADNGWRCTGAPELGKFRGPGRKEDPCPIVNVYALKALAQVPEWRSSGVTQAGAEMLLGHWQNRGQKKHYLFGIGTDFIKLKYPFVWYDILHVAEVLSHYPALHGDPRFQEMVEAVVGQAGADGAYTPTSMYLAWKGWSFADKKKPSPWLTFLVLRLARRVGRNY